MSAWTGDNGNLYLYGIKVPGFKSIEAIDEGVDAIPDVTAEGQVVYRRGKSIPPEFIIRLDSFQIDSNPELHPEVKDQVIEELMARVLKLEQEKLNLEKQKLDLTKALLHEIFDSEWFEGNPYRKPSEIPMDYLNETIEQNCRLYDEREEQG
jgi:hypothetical protein